MANGQGPALPPSTGSGTSAGNGKQGGTGFGLVPLRAPAVRSPVPAKK